MRNVKKVLAILLLLALCTSILSCASCKMEKPVATCAGYEILYEELRYVTLNQKDVMRKQYGSTIFDTPESAELYRDELEQAVTERLKESYAVLAACNYYLPNLKLDSKEIEKEVDAYFDAIENKKEYLKQAEKQYMTESFLRLNLSVAIMKDHLRVELCTRGICFSDSQQDAFFSWIRGGNGAYVQHIFIRNDEGESVEENRALAQDIANRLSDGTLTLQEAISSAAYNQDPSNLSPYYVIKNNDLDPVSDPKLEEAILALSSMPAGSVSAPVEVENGFYVYYRLGDSDDFLRGNLETLLDEHQKSMTERVIAEFSKGLVIEWNDYGKSLDLLEIQ